MESMKLAEGEIYFSIVVLNSIKLAAFKNKNKKNPKEPDYRGEGVAVWINKKKPRPQEEPKAKIESEF